MLKKLIFVLILTISINAQTMEEVMEENKSKLNDMQYYVTQECGTEPALIMNIGIIKAWNIRRCCIWRSFICLCT